ncbi:MAG: peptidyl-prolyl cis-trans isomerase [Candidatus Methanomethylophilaceae archaeon]|nr:peptidyl-prolyl cis-trans isomerase [Candidatus Methanomethylophilaceae archaeon]MDI3542045.1 peptidyl-prolyl cis-trans isomerase [Candidatus Methanomethylophilaceae archaeon]
MFAVINQSYSMEGFIIQGSVLSRMVKQVRASHILVQSEKKAKEIMEFVNGGETFESMAKKYSECPSAKNGGDLGWFGRGKMVPEFENAAFKAKPGTVVGPVRTQFGWHLIMVTDTK